MKDFFKKKKKIATIFLVLLVVLTGCSTPRGKDGKTKIDQIIAIEELTVKKSEVNIEDSTEEMQEKYANYGDDDLITIEATTIGDMWNNDGLFNTVIVYPLSQLINFISSISNAGVGIIGGTFLILALVFVLTIKSQVATQKMQDMQPLINQINAKYEGKTDQNSQMKKAQETQALYKKHGISPFGSLISSFIQIPIMFGMMYASIRAASIIQGDFFGIPLAVSPQDALSTKNYAILVIFVLMIIAQAVSFKLPQLLASRRKREAGIKEKKYAQAKAAGPNMNSMLYVSVGMSAFFGFTWPLAMSFYYLVQSVFRILQNIIIHKFFSK